MAAVVAIHPDDVMRLRMTLAPAFDALARDRQDMQAVALVRDWRAYCARPIDWLNAPDELEHGYDLEARLSVLQGPGDVDHNTGPIRTGAIVTPGDVLAYRNMWDGFVLGTARAAQGCADAWDAAAAGQTPTSTINMAQFSAPPDPKTLALYAQTQRINAESIVTDWNMHADISDWELVVQASDILQDYQRVVLKVGQGASCYQAQIAKDCPTIALPLVPSMDVQSQVISRIEGLGILAHGILQLIGMGTSGGLETLGAVAQTVKETVTTAARTLPVVAVGVVAGLVLIVLARK